MQQAHTELELDQLEAQYGEEKEQQRVERSRAAPSREDGGGAMPTTVAGDGLMADMGRVPRETPAFASMAVAWQKSPSHLHNIELIL